MGSPAVDERIASEYSRLSETVLDGGYCVGCGACASLPGEAAVIVNAPSGLYQLQWRSQGAGHGSTLPNPLKVCPFAEKSLSEDEIAEIEFPDLQQTPTLGRTRNVFIGSVADPTLRAKGSSGAVMTWLLQELLRRRMVDGIIHVGEGVREGEMFGYRVSKSESEVSHRAKTRYYPANLSEVLAQIRATPGRYAVVGVPCYIKAVRLLAREDSRIRERIGYTLAVFCGHMKTRAFAEHLGWQIGIHPNTLSRVEFRVKSPSRPANRYSIEAVSDQGIRSVAQAAHLAGSDWGLGFFKPKACDYCDDIVGETADISFGDAWLPEDVSDSRGTSIVVTRSAALDSLIPSYSPRGAM